jgi:hypothetical protein
LVANPAMRQKFQIAGARILASTPEEAAAKAAAERPMWREVIKTSGAKPQ